MSASGGHAGEAEALRERFALFRDAALRINESLDLDVVLQGVLDSARELTGGKYGLLSLVGGDGELEACLTSGLTAEQSYGFLHGMPDRWELYEFLVGVEAPVRVGDFQGYLAEHGLPEFLPPFPVSAAMAYLAAPVRHSGERSGVIYVTEKEGGFTAEDEETLAVFASLAAVVISNARRFESERRARADLEGLISAAPMSVVVFDAESGAVRSVNREARRLLGDLGASFGSAEDLVAQVTYRRGDREEEVLVDGESLEEALRSGQAIRDLELTAGFPDGRSVALMVNVAPIVGVDNKVESVVVAAQDMTPLAELERLRSEFLGMISHELRAPLAAIKGSATTLLQGVSTLDGAEMVQFFRIIDEQADTMRELLSDLIDIVRIETGTLAVTPAPAALTRIVDEARDTFVGMGGRENILIDFPPDLPAVMADRRRVAQVFSNLLTNAARHSHDGSAIRVEAEVDGVHVVVSVVDSGRGMLPERIPQLFAKFSRPDGSDPGRNLGLGLAICKGIIEAHGGRIWAESDGPGLGSRFTFTLPVSHAAAPGEMSWPAGAPRGRGAREPIRVLAVDDDPRALKRVRDALAAEGYDPTVTGDPDEVELLIAEVDPHVVLLDLMLPGTDGIELMRRIVVTCDAPVIFLSAYSRKDLIANALETGAADYIIKPFSPTELAARIRAALRGRGARRGAAVAGAGSAGPLVPDRFELGDLTIDFSARLVHAAGQPVGLAPLEYRLLAELAANAGTVVTHDRLLAGVWGPASRADTNRMRTVIKNLRQKLGDNARDPRYIFTAARVGYRMPRPDTPEPPA